MAERAQSISGIRIVLVMARRELVRFIRQPGRVAGAIGTPVLLWIFLASGFVDSVRSETVGGTSYAAFLLPGMISLTAVFAAILSSIAVIEDRHAGWLQAALVSPAPRWSLAIGQVLGGATIAFAQAAILLLAIPLLDLAPNVLAIVASLVGVFATSMAMASLGIIFAWRVESSAAFHAVMNLVFMPLWLLSGAFMPADGGATWFTTIVKLNPLHWCTEAIRQPLTGGAWLVPMLIACAFALFTAGLAVLDVSRSSRQLAG